MSVNFKVCSQDTLLEEDGKTKSIISLFLMGLVTKKSKFLSVHKIFIKWPKHII
jgi:hypothetical protein